MSNLRQNRRKINSKIEVIKKINDNGRNTSSSLSDIYIDNIDVNTKFGNKLNQISNKKILNKNNDTDIFSNIIDISNKFITNNAGGVINENDGLGQRKIKNYAIDSARITVNSLRDIIGDNVKNVFFSNDGICGTDKIIDTDVIRIKPSEIDFLNLLTVDINSSTGKIFYEPESPNTGRQKVNRELYKSFTDGPYVFTTINGKDLFTVTWIEIDQEYEISGLTQLGSNVLIRDFLNDYYSSIEMPDIDFIIRTAMMMTIQGDDSNSLLFKKSINNLNRLFKKIFKSCGNDNNTDELRNQTSANLIDSEDLSYYFNFNDVEGINIDDEDDRLRGVLKFTDCGNFEIPVNNENLEDFVYYSTRKNLNDLVDETFQRLSEEYSERSGSSIPIMNFNISLLNGFILNLPRAIVTAILGPKIFLPIVIVYKLINGSELSVIELMGRLSKLFFEIISKTFWLFVTNFWVFIKIELLRFILVLVNRIIKNKYRRYVIIITALISLIRRALSSNNIDSCNGIYETILKTIDTALSVNGQFNIPGIILGLSDRLPGYSQDRSLLNISERLENAGISLGPIYGDENKLISVVKAIIDGHTEEMDSNSFVKVSNKEIIIPSPVGPIIIPPGILNSAGKVI